MIQGSESAYENANKWSSKGCKDRVHAKMQMNSPENGVREKSAYEIKKGQREWIIDEPLKGSDPDVKVAMDGMRAVQPGIDGFCI